MDHPLETGFHVDNELQRLRLELADRDREVARLQAEIDRLNLSQTDLSSGRIQRFVEELFGEIAAPVAQYFTQADLIENQGKVLQSRDVLLVSRRMIQALQNAGLEIFCQVGETAAFDPNQHQPLGSSTGLDLGQKVRVRFVGVKYQGTILRKASVEKVED